MTYVGFVTERKQQDGWWKPVMVLKAWMLSYVYTPCYWTKQCSWTSAVSVGWRYTRQ